jgi:hypothetical protein
MLNLQKTFKFWRFCENSMEDVFFTFPERYSAETAEKRNILPNHESGYDVKGGNNISTVYHLQNNLINL